MRGPTMIAALGALAVAPAAHAADLCDTINRAIAAGLKDKGYSDLGKTPPAPDGFTCELSIVDDRGIYACTMEVEPPAGLDKARALLAALKPCLSEAAQDNSSGDSLNYSWTFQEDPEVRLILSSADYSSSVDLNINVW